MSKTTVMAGPCGFKTVIEAAKKDRNTISLNIKTDCKFYKPLEEDLKEVDAYEEVFSKYGQGNISKLCAQYSKHATCPVACAILKAVEVEAGLALPVNVTIEIEK